MKLGDLSVSYINIVAKAFGESGGDTQALYEQFSISEESLSSPEARVSIPKFMRIGHACIQAVEQPWFGLTMGKSTQVSDLGFAGLIAQCAPNLQTACQQLAVYEILNKYNIRGQSSFHTIKPNVKRNNNGDYPPMLGLNCGAGVLKFYSIKPYNNYNFFVVDSVIAGWITIIETLCGRDDAIEQVCFEYSAPAYAEKYHEFFNCEVLFKQKSNYIVIKKQALNWPCIGASQTTQALLKRIADNELNKVKLGLSFNEKVSRAIVPLLDGATPTLEQVAIKLNMPPWTVRRKLIDEGSSFQKTLNKTRMELSMSYVRDTLLSLNEIGYLIGFGSPSAFQRAFKRWTGIAPGLYRSQFFSYDQDV